MKRYLHHLVLSFPVCFLFVFTVLLYGPFSLYLSNAEEFWFSAGTVAKVVLPVSAIVMILLLLLFFLLPDHAASIGRKLLFGVSLGLYIQGNYMNISYGSGVLDGTGIHWEYYTKYGLATTLVWIACLIFPFVLPRIVKRFTREVGRTTEQILMAVSAAIVLMQVPAFAVQALSWKPLEASSFSITNEGEFELGDQENVIVFVLDTLDEAYYQDFLKEYPDYPQQLTGFVHYGNTLASGARTPVGVPSMFTGIPFTRKESYNDYKQKVWGQDNGLSLLHDAGYEVRVFSENVLYSKECTEYVANFTDESANVGSWGILLKNLYKLDMYKFVPHYLKRFFLIDTADFDAAMEAEELYMIQDAQFWERYREKGLSVEKDLHKAVRIYHLRGAHQAYLLSREGKYLEGASLMDTTAGSFYCVSRYLEDLKDKGLYDSSTIIITADHGDLNKAEQAIFLVKRKGSSEAYQDDMSPVSLFDLPIFLAKVAGKTLEDLPYSEDLDELSENTVRERHFFRHKSGSISSVIHEYVTTGNQFDPEELKKIKTYEDKSDPEEYVLGTELSFGIEQTGNQYIVDGFANNTGIRTVLYGPHSILSIPIKKVPGKGKLHVHVDVTMSKSMYENEMVIYANDEEVFRGLTDQTVDENGLDFDIPVSVMDDTKVLTLDFSSPWISEEEMELKVVKRTDTLRFVTLTISAD